MGFAGNITFKMFTANQLHWYFKFRLQPISIIDIMFARVSSVEATGTHRSPEPGGIYLNSALCRSSADSAGNFSPFKKPALKQLTIACMNMPVLHASRLLLVAFVCIASMAKAGKPSLEWASKVGAKTFPAKKTVFTVTAPANDTNIISTKAIQQTIDACAAKGGGIVVFKPGTYVTGSLFIKSNVNLRIDKGVLILGSTSFNDYPEIDTRIAGIEMKWPAALFNIIGQKNAALTGDGVVNARGKFCWDKYWTMRRQVYEPKGLRWIVDYDAKRVRTLLVQNSSDITLKGVTFKNAGFWTVQILYSTRVTADGLIVRNNEDGKGPSTDGIDIDSSSWVLVENCDIDCNDDDFCLKSGRDWDGLRVNRPTEYVVIRKCVAQRGGGLLTLGSETSGGIRHVLATDILAKGTGNGFHIKSATTRGGTVEDIWFQHVVLDSVNNAFHFTMNWNPTYSYSTLPAGYHPDSIPAHWKVMLKKVEPAEKGIPHFKDIHISDIVMNGARRFVSATGLQESPLDNFNFTDMQGSASTAGDISFGKNWNFSNVQIKFKDNKKPEIKNSTGVELK